jgi:hypothetical protein
VFTTDSVHVFLLESVHTFSLSSNAESSQKALTALLGHVMCVADRLMAGRHDHHECTTACDCIWVGAER